MKIIQVIGGGEKGGSRNHIITLSKELIKRGMDVEIICFLDDVIVKNAKKNDIPVTVFPMKRITNIFVIRKLYKYLKKENPDIIHTHGFRANFIGRLAGWRINVPLITTVHSSIYHDYAKFLKRVFYHRIEKMTRPLTNKFITVAGSLKTELEKDKISSKKIEVVYNGLSPDFPLNKEVNPSIRKKYRISDDVPILITIGRLEKVKNQEMLLEVFATLKQNSIDFRGLIVGDGPLEIELRTLAKKLDIEDKVHFLGFRTDIYNLLVESDLFLLTSDMEGLPITLLESMATKTAVVVTDVGGMPEIVQVAKNGYVVPVDDIVQFAARIEEIIVQPELKQKFVKSGYDALLQNFTSEKFTENTISVYRQTLKELKKVKN